MATTSESDSTPSGDQHKRRGSRRKWYLLALALFFILIAVAYGLYYFLYARFYATTDDAYVHGNRIMLSPQVAGTVVAIHADDTDRVDTDDTLVQLDQTDFNTRLQRASANLAQTVRGVRQLYAQAEEQRSTVQARQTSARQAFRDYQRDQRLAKVHGIAEQAFEQSRATYRRNKAALAAAKHRLAELNAQTQGTTLRTHPRVRSAEADLRSAYLNLRRTRIAAPVGGYVAERTVQIGQQADPGTPMLSVIPLNQVWVNANFKETELDQMRIGQPAVVTTDLYGSDVVYHGHVAGISPGTGAAFELLPPQNATGNWIKIVRRVPVRIVLNEKDIAEHPLRIGLSAEVTVNLHDTKGAVLARTAPKKTRYQTAVYRKRLKGAKRLIKQIVEANDGDPSTPATAAVRDGDGGHAPNSDKPRLGKTLPAS